MEGPTFKKTNEPPKSANQSSQTQSYSEKHTKSFNVTFKLMVENGNARKATNTLL